MIEFRYLQPEDAERAAEIHIEGQRGTVLTMLGRPFLVELYRAVCSSKWGEGIGVYDDGCLVGQTAMAVSSARFFAEFKRKHLWRVALPTALAVIKQPQILNYTLKAWRYPEQARSPEREGDVIFLGVTAEYTRRGLAPEIVRHMFGWAASIGLVSANFMVEKRNRPMRWMIGQLNDLYIAYEFEAYGRTMLFYKIPIASNLADAKLPLGKPYTPAYIYSTNGRG
jgi:ribosomal protein S18 acetylase RimI-like enzyme